MSEERARYQSGAATPELTPEQRAAAHIARQFASNGMQMAYLLDAVYDALTAAEERGRVAEREACMQLAAGYIHDAGCGDSYSYGFRWAATNILKDIRDRITPPPPKELGAEESGGV